MEKAFTLENFISNWNGDFPDYPLTPADLKTPHAVMGALFQIFDRLGIDRDAVLAPPPEETRTENTSYYWDLIPVINMTRVINHLVSVMPQVSTISVSHFLQPTATTSHSILLLLFNLMLFNDDRLRDIAPYEEELFAKTDEVKTLEDKKNRLVVMLNQQAEEKGKRAERLEKLDRETEQYEQELKQENELNDAEKQELEIMVKDNKQLEMLVDQKKTHLETITSEVARKKALRVYDADDIKAQAEKATQDVQEAEEKLNSLRVTLMEKENSLKNLQTIKPSLDSANNLLHEIMKLSESLKDLESGDLESDSKEGELAVLEGELCELGAQLADLRTAAGDTRALRRKNAPQRLHERNTTLSALREAEEKDKKSKERSRKAVERTEEIKELTLRYEEQKAKGIVELETIKKNFCNDLKVCEDLIMKKVVEAEKKISDKLRNRHL